MKNTMIGYFIHTRRTSHTVGFRGPVPVLVVGRTLLGWLLAQLSLDAEGGCVRRVGGELWQALLALAGEGQVVAVPDRFFAYLVIGGAALYSGHCPKKADKLVDGDAAQRTGQALVAAQRGEPQDGGHIGIGVVLRRGRPTADDGPNGEGLAKPFEVLPIAVEGLPGGTITVGHTLELYKTFIGLLFPCTLPLVGRVTEVERVVVSSSSGFHNV